MSSTNHRVRQAAEKPFAIDQALQQAIAHHQAGRLPEAERIYRDILQRQPAQADANHNLGVVAVQVGQPAAALPFLKLALEVNPNQAQYWLSYLDALVQAGQSDAAREVLVRGRAKGLQGDAVDALAAHLDGNPLSIADAPASHEMEVLVALFNSRRFAEAVAAAKSVTERYPAYALGWKALGTILQEMNRSAESLGPMQKAVSMAPTDAEAHNNLGNTLKSLQRLDDAVASYQRALTLKPDFALAYYNLASTLTSMERLQEAEASYHQAVSVQPDFAEAHNNRGAVQERLGREAEAKASYLRALELNPNYAEAHNNYGAILKMPDEQAEAEAHYRRALELKPDFVEAHNNLGVVLKNSDRVEEAIACHERTLVLDPNYVGAHYNLAAAFKVQGQVDKAEAGYRRALELKPDYAEARGNLSMLLLQQGRYAEGWKEFESRADMGRKDRQTGPPPAPVGGPPLPPQWRGEALAGKSVLIWPEQGFGDEIQFARYMQVLKGQGVKRLVLACKPPLQSLFEGQGLADVVVNAATWAAERTGEFDYWSNPLSLPLHCGTTLDNLPATIPYLQADPARVSLWHKRLPEVGVRVGLVWKGRPTHKNDAHRSLESLATLAPLWDVPGVRFISLQMGVGEDEAASPPSQQPLIHLGGDIADFADSAALIAQLDLLICVDTAVAHLAGALGKTCWVLLPSRDTDWRWLEKREDSPWYPGVMRLFRQSPNDPGWDNVVERVAEALNRFINHQGSPS